MAHYNIFFTITDLDTTWLQKDELTHVTCTWSLVSIRMVKCFDIYWIGKLVVSRYTV